MDINGRALRALKAELRSLLLQRRDAVPAELRIEHGQAILARLSATEAFQSAGVVMAYCGVGSEIDTRPLLRAALRGGKTLALPKVNRAAGILDIFAVRDLDADLESGVWGIREPNPGTCARVAPAELDVILVPGIAFDLEGGRIGYGEGFYDRFLRACHDAGSRPVTVAAAFSFQLLDAVPMERHDVRIDAIATETGYYHCRRR